MGDKSSSNSASPRKLMKFSPKVPPRKPPPTVTAKTDPPDDASIKIDSELMKKLRAHESSGRKLSKVPRKTEPTVTFGHTDNSMYARSFGNPGVNADERRYRVPTFSVETMSALPELDDLGNSASGMSFEVSGGMADGMNSKDGGEKLARKQGKKHVDPWDMTSYYPITLPLRKPDSRCPEILDEEEFGKASESSVEDANKIRPAETLGLMERSNEARLLFFQLPASLPQEKKSASQKDGSGRILHGLPSGLMGKMLVYQSGIVKMKLGDVLLDVSPGVDCIFPQDVAAINMDEKHCCIVGEINKRAVLSLDMDYLLNAKINSD
ncbi:DNA-directed RNA polymerase III subunit RPC4 protein [Dioscorea alata]|uniref:DNA-directed RNA polymerase III subunit RPC4 protein n=4 Tax=Dioscorea alata TaxID=55571 RepID=A0ACB7UT85_DIOAL|nr:DNA-directed RNA polymerase III subunit RPC4 protein [Dioscorea alata]KAH7663849.1 DNA-directed RNA polymerase III subunit RPC4 protein [Dioscorea alata]KAH7663850.1 DNA-directed RNA polymerase III subunit RPC4 protein [Dioscorea alata]KAH7663851.1 DNA-directed RNA polymerase III subunit RPC4 protein [Dioscorea alata]